MTEQATIERTFNEKEQRWEEKVTPPKPRRLTVADIEAADDILEQEVEVPEWGGTVLLRQFTKDVEFQMREQATVGGKIDDARLEMLILINSVIDPPLTPEHIGLLRSKSNTSVDRLLEKAALMNRMTKGAVDAEKARFPQGPGPGVPVPPDEGPSDGDAQADEAVDVEP